MVIDKDHILNLIREVKDPDIPVVDVVEMGIVRNVEELEGKLVVTITPTYSGCPAMGVIQEEIVQVLISSGYENVEVISKLSPAWTTDWIDKEARRKMKEHGIAPPLKTQATKGFDIFEERKITCPFCDSEDSKLQSEFGSTACKALYFCNACRQPFEHFKCI